MVLSLRERLRDLPQEGRVSWIGLRPAHGAAMQVVKETVASAVRGLAGDRAHSGDRQVTLVQAEHLPVIARFAGRDAIAPQQLRRNLVIEGINLLALVRLSFAIGDEVILTGTGPCAPLRQARRAARPRRLPGDARPRRHHGSDRARRDPARRRPGARDFSRLGRPATCKGRLYPRRKCDVRVISAG